MSFDYLWIDNEARHNAALEALTPKYVLNDSINLMNTIKNTTSRANEAMAIGFGRGGFFFFPAVLVCFSYADYPTSSGVSYLWHC